MTEEEKTVLKGVLLQEWSDARAERTCCEEKLERIWEGLSKLVLLTPGEVSIASEDTFTAGGRLNPVHIRFPSFAEISGLMKKRDEAHKAMDAASERLGKMGIVL